MADAPRLEPSWLAVLGDEFERPHMKRLRAFLVEEKQRHAVFPPGKDIFNAFACTPFDAVRVVILGQDPYHEAGQAHGLSFSVLPGVAPPPSLRNIFKEIATDIGAPEPDNGCLTHWARQGVLLLNTVLTVRAGTPQSHAGQGWEQFTDRVVAELNDRRDGLAFALWGQHAQQKAQAVDGKRHLLLATSHPSPYSANAGFLGCRHFSRINQWLLDRGTPPIDWGLPTARTPLG